MAALERVLVGWEGHCNGVTKGKTYIIDQEGFFKDDLGAKRYYSNGYWMLPDALKAVKAEKAKTEVKGSSALDHQEGGSHYKLPIQPVEFITKNKLGFCEGNVVKYITRWRSKNGLQDLLKVKHYVDLLIELEGLNQTQGTK
jgi:hypothetical protein